MKRTENSEHKSGYNNCLELIYERGITFVRKYYNDKMQNSGAFMGPLIASYWKGYKDCIEAYDFDNSP